MGQNVPIVEWQGRRVWVVGASTGIGASLASRLAKAGARLALSARSRDKLDALAVAAPGALVLPLDVRDVAQQRDAYASIVAR